MEHKIYATVTEHFIIQRFMIIYIKLRNPIDAGLKKLCNSFHLLQIYGYVFPSPVTSQSKFQILLVSSHQIVDYYTVRPKLVSPIRS